MTIQQVIDNIIRREGGAKATNIVGDKGGRTQYGIAERSNPNAWKDGKVTREEAEEIFTTRYAKPFERLSEHPCFEQLVDWAVTSGPILVVQKLQAIVGVEQDGVVGAQTEKAVADYQGNLSTAICKARLAMISRIIQRDPSQAKFAAGWINRCIEFI